MWRLGQDDTKTMKSQMHRHQFLPMVAPAVGVDGSNWALAWLDVRRQLGVAWPPEGLVMPAPDRQGIPDRQTPGNPGMRCLGQKDRWQPQRTAVLEEFQATL